MADNRRSEVDESISDAEVQRILDDPGIPDHLKTQIIGEWAGTYRGSSDGDLPDHVQDYVDRYDAADAVETYRHGREADSKTEPDRKLGDYYDNSHEGIAELDLMDSIEEARGIEESLERRAGNRGHLDSAANAHDSGNPSGDATSEPMFNAGAVGLEFFHNFIPQYNDWAGASLDYDAICRSYDEQREVAFGRLQAEVDRLNSAYDALDTIRENLRGHGSALAQVWSGGAAAQAQNQIHNFLTNSDTFMAKFKELATTLESSALAAEEACYYKADYMWVFEPDATELGGSYSPNQVALLIKVARKEANDEELASIASQLGVEYDTGGCGNNVPDSVRDEAAYEANRWLNAWLIPRMEGHKAQFDDACIATDGLLVEAWGQLNDALADIGPEIFDAVSQGGGDGSGGDGSGGNGSGGGMPDSGAGGGGSGGGSGAGGGGAPPMPDLPPGGLPTPPETPEIPDPGPMPEIGDLPPGLESPDGPGTGTPEDPFRVQPDVPGGPVTIENGEDEITVNPPGDDGQVELEIVGPDGEKQSYEIDFGPGGPGTVPGQYQTMPDEASFGPGAPSTMPGGPTAPVQVPGGPDGLAGWERPGEDGPQPIQPDADGRAVIQDGDSTISVQPAPAGQPGHLITVEDAEGNSTSYLTEFGSGDPLADRVGNGLRDQPSGFQTMPHAVNPDFRPGGGEGPRFEGTWQSPTGEQSQPIGAQGFGGGNQQAQFGPGGTGGFGNDVPQAPGAGQGAFGPPQTMPAGAGGFGPPQGFTPPGFTPPEGFGPSPGGGQDGGPPGISAAAAHSSGPGMPGPSGAPQGFAPGGGAAAQWGPPSDVPGMAPSTSTPQAPPAGQAGFGVLPDSGQPGQPGQAAAAGSGGGQGAAGGGMMGGMAGGGMGGGGGGQGGGENQERGASQWRVQGELFDAGEAAKTTNRIRALLGDDD
ncbi:MULTISPECIES: WXG100 family type VII secretion target [Actinoalloteichus]|uniref:WXG100 family type VII secretion target n=1 Tax=Actinoalloteichus fjordicus TaxID=1612552 RepID=A0AAC9LJT6_9PSEU|nr:MULTISPECIES: WXG100 family type VII secretion target [Actinoalloteichus]APU17605.1 hypothetical protein UA74_28020 [Actinoalloteichus fjordicus]APU23681.1 hypothetical protein UA75_28550 [Actinoalloteichus sp. GBA129-24]